MKQLYLLDAYALIYRAYFPFSKRPRLDSKGRDTSAVYGFVNVLNELLGTFRPEHIAVVFDPPGGSFRQDFYPEYKANRSETPEAIRFAVPLIKEFIKAMGIEVLEVANYEADDVIGTLSVQAERAGFEVLMVTPDKDYSQLVTPRVSILSPVSGGGYEELGVKDVCEKFGIQEPRQVIDALAIMGDSTDNFQGIPKVGPVGAQKLLATYGTLENLLEHAEEITGKLGEYVRSGKESAKLAKRLATIELNVPIQLDDTVYERREVDILSIRTLFTDLELRTQLERITQQYQKQIEAPQQAKAKTVETIQTDDTDIVRDLFGEPLETTNKLNFQVDTKIIEDQERSPVERSYTSKELSIEGVLDELIGALTPEARAYAYTLAYGEEAHQQEMLSLAIALEDCDDIYYSRVSELSGEELLKLLHALDGIEMLIGYDLKSLLLACNRSGFYPTRPRMEDVMIAHYILTPDMSHSLRLLSSRYLGLELLSFEELIEPQKVNNLELSQIDEECLKNYTLDRAFATKHLHTYLIQELKARGQYNLLTDIEMPLMPILLDMELEGILLDQEELARQEEDYAAELLRLEEEIYELASERFNLNSAKQVGEILFDKLKLDEKAKKTKGGSYTTSEEVLEKYRDKHLVVEKILEYRGIKKLYSTYITALPKLVDSAGKVHTSFNQTIAATGRLSSSNPNLQNIPIRTDMGRKIRAAFVPEVGSTFLSADYSQIELRLMAHFSEDVDLIEAFIKGQDIHQATAARIARVPLEKVTAEMRRRAKTANFGIIYGISAFGLAERLGVSRKEAKQLIEGYFLSYPGVDRYMKRVVAEARTKGYVQTLLGRRRYLPDINSRNAVVRGYAERNAINAPLQGTAADIIKLAMIAISKEVKVRGLKSRMILQVHDELNFNVPLDELEEMKTLVHQCMSVAGGNLRVPLEVGIGYGHNWLEAH